MSPQRAVPPFIDLPPEGGHLVIARDPGPGVIAIDDHSLSRQEHARLTVKDGQVQVENLAGPGRCRLHGRDFETATLADGQMLRFGRVPYERVGPQLRCRLNQDGVRVEVRRATVDVSTGDGVQRLLDRVSISLEANELVAIIGPSGAGKSTLLRALAGEQALSSGHIEVSDHRGPLSEQWTQTGLGFVPQDDALHGDLSVAKSLEYAARLRLSQASAEDRERAQAQVLSQLDLTEQASQVIARSLSGGQRKRVNLAHELLASPRLLCLDEPTAGLDPHLSQELSQCFQQMARLGSTVLVSTHVLDSLSLYDRVIVLAEGGRLAYQGPPAELKAHFGIEQWHELYPLLSRERKIERPTEDSVVLDKVQSLRRLEAPRPFFQQTWTLISRDLRRLMGDLRQLAMLLFLPIVVGLGIRFALPELVDRETILFFGVVALFWFGLQRSSGECVGERQIYLRERRTGLPPLAYLLSKVSQQALIGVIQSLGLMATFYLEFQDQRLLGLPSGWLPGFLGSSLSGFDGYAYLMLTSGHLLGSLIGLCVSAFVRHEKLAGLFVPMLIIPMLLFSAKGMASSDTLGLLSQRSPDLPREYLAAINPARLVYELIYTRLMTLSPPSWSEAWIEYSLLFGLALLCLSASYLFLRWEGQGQALPSIPLSLPDFESHDMTPKQRRRARLAAEIVLSTGRCGRCGYHWPRPEPSDQEAWKAPCKHCRVSPLSAEAGEFLKPAQAVSEVFTGASYLARGLWIMVSRPRLLKFAILPVLLNVAFVLAAFYGAYSLSQWLEQLTPEALNDWQGPLWGRLRLAVLSLAVISGRVSMIFIPAVAAFIFALLGKFPAMIYMEFLAEKTFEEFLGPAPESDASWLDFLKNLGRGLLDAVLVMLLQLLLLVLFFPLAYLPLIGPLLWLAGPAALTVSIDYMDLNWVVRHYSIKEKCRLLWRRKGRFFGFGLAFFVCIEWPWVNLLLSMVLIPAATVGGALMYLELDER